MKIKGVYRENLRQEFKNPIADNISAFFLDKSIGLSNYVVLIMPKYFLHNSDFSMSREKIKNTNIQCITDFGETGFKGVLIETICLFLDTKSNNTSGTKVISVPKKLELIQDQNEITQSFFLIGLFILTKVSKVSIRNEFWNF
jgi:DNA (cytosine-5)-methyltransferase 1